MSPIGPSRGKYLLQGCEKTGINLLGGLLFQTRVSLRSLELSDSRFSTCKFLLEGLVRPEKKNNPTN